MSNEDLVYSSETAAHSFDVFLQDGTRMLEDDGTPVSFELTPAEYDFLVQRAAEKGTSFEEELAEAIMTGVELLNAKASQ